MTVGSVPSNFEIIATDIAKLVERKNNDYGSAFDKLMDEYPEYYPIRITEKLNRFKSVTRNGAMCVTDESLHDTVKDIIGYSLLYLNYVKEQEAKTTAEINAQNGWGSPDLTALSSTYEQIIPKRTVVRKQSVREALSND